MSWPIAAVFGYLEEGRQEGSLGLCIEYGITAQPGAC